MLRAEFASLLTRPEQYDDLSENEAQGALALELMLLLCRRVDDEDPLEGLASQLASVDITALSEPAPDSSAALFFAAHAAALEADLPNE